MDKQELQTKKGLLDKLYYKIGKQKYNFWVCGTFTDDEGNKKFTKWKKYLDCVANIDVLNLDKNDWKDLKFFENIDQRQIMGNEVVLDIEDPTELKPIMEKIKNWKIDNLEYHIFSTGSRGFHVHLFFQEEFTTEEKEAIIKDLGTDLQKCSEKNLIALENCPHWKTGNTKKEIEYE